MKRALTEALKLLTMVLVLALSLVCSAWLHVRTTLGSRVVRSEVNTLLQPLFVGRIEISKLGTIGLTGASGIDAQALDGDDVVIASIANASARINAFDLVRDVAFGRGPLVIRITEVHAASARVLLDRAPSGKLRIEEAFVLRDSGPALAGSAPARPVLVHLPDIRIDVANIVGEPAPGLSIDSLVTFARGSLLVPSTNEAPLSITAKANVQTRGILTAVEGALLGDHLDATVNIPKRDASTVGALAGIPLHGLIAVAARVRGTLAGADLYADVHLDDSEIHVNGFGSVEQRSVRASVRAQRFNLAHLGGPDSRLEIASDLFGAWNADTGSPTGSATFVIEPGRVADQSTPPLRGELELLANKNGPMLSFSTETNANLGDLAPAPSGFAGALHAKAKGAIDLRNLAVVADVAAEVTSLSGPGAWTIRSGSLAAHLSGPLRALRFTTRATLLGVHGGSFNASRVQAEAQVQWIEAARFALGSVSVLIQNQAMQTYARAEQVSIDGANFDVPAAQIFGMGEPIEFAASRRAGEITLSVRAPQVDLGRAARFLALPSLSGLATVIGNARLRGDDLEGDLIVSLEHFAYEKVRDARLFVRSSLHQGELSFNARASVAMDEVARIVPELAAFGSAGRVDLHAELVDDKDAKKAKTAQLLFDLSVTDNRGKLMQLEVTIAMAPNVLLRPLKLEAKPLLAMVWTAPLHAKLTVPKRAIADFPAFPKDLRLNNVAGMVEAQANLEGTLRNLKAEVHVDGTVIRARAAIPSKSGKGGGRAELSAVVGGANVEDLIDVDKRSAALAALFANARLELTAFPLQILPRISTKKIRGQVTGLVVLTDFHQHAGLEVALESTTLRIGSAAFPKVRVGASAHGDSVNLSVHLEQAAGYADLTAHAGMRWDAQWFPTLREDRSVALDLRAVKLRAVVLEPFLGSAVSDVDGLIDAEVHVAVGSGGKGFLTSGRIALTQGSFSVLALGQEYREAEAIITLASDGSVRLTHASARDPSGKIFATGRARFREFTFLGGEASLSAAKATPADLTVQGQSLGTVWGELRVQVDPGERGQPSEPGESGEGMKVSVIAKPLHATLTETSGRELQSLEKPIDIHVGLVRNGEFRRLPIAAANTRKGAKDLIDPVVAPPLRIAVHFGDDVELRRGPVFRAGFTGDLQVTVPASTPGKLLKLRVGVPIMTIGRRTNTTRGSRKRAMRSLPTRRQRWSPGM
jgi:hypothetical protein